MDQRKVTIETEFIKLDSLLKYAGAAPTGGHAKEMVLGGGVSVNGEVCLQRGKKVRPGDHVTAAGMEIEVCGP